MKENQDDVSGNVYEDIEDMYIGDSLENIFYTVIIQKDFITNLKMKWIKYVGLQVPVCVKEQVGVKFDENMNFLTGWRK